MKHQSLKGRKDDQEKLRWDLLPLEVIEGQVRVLSFGAKKYGANNWKDVENLSERYYAALLRHLCAWRKGEKNDAETGLPHLDHVQCCVTFIRWAEK